VPPARYPNCSRPAFTTQSNTGPPAAIRSSLKAINPVTVHFVKTLLDWNTYRQQLLARVDEIANISPDTVKGYQTLRAAGQKTSLLGPKMRELISLAVAVTARCDSCITVHTEAAVRHGASREEIAEALAVATAVNAGAALVYSARILDAYEQVTPRQPA
jgi:AhpD family alkylhydroperoxidase